MWVRDNEKYKAKEFIIKNADELHDLPEQIDIEYDFPGLREPQDTHVTVKLLDNSLAVANRMKDTLVKMISKADAFIVKEGTAKDGSPCIDLVFSVYNVEKYESEVPSDDVLKDLGLM